MLLADESTPYPDSRCRHDRVITGGSPMRLVAAVLVGILEGTASPEEPRPTHAVVTNAIDRCRAFLAKDALAWKSEHKCCSWHHAGLIIWALHEAKDRGHAVDGPVLADLTKWVAESGDGKTGLARPAAAPKALN